MLGGDLHGVLLLQSTRIGSQITNHNQTWFLQLHSDIVFFVTLRILSRMACNAEKKARLPRISQWLQTLFLRTHGSEIGRIRYDKDMRICSVTQMINWSQHNLHNPSRIDLVHKILLTQIEVKTLFQIIKVFRGSDQNYYNAVSESSQCPPRTSTTVPGVASAPGEQEEL